MRPGLVPGRFCIGLLALVGGLLALAPTAPAQELFAWFNRGLLKLDYHAGDWVRYESGFTDEYGLVTDTLTVTLMQLAPTAVWLRMESGEGTDFVQLDPRALAPGSTVLDALLRVVHQTPEGLVDEDMHALRESALVQRHFADPFDTPEITRTALPDSVVQGVTLGREAVGLSEVRRESAANFVVVTELQATAELSGQVPLLGVLSSLTHTTVRTEAADGTRARRHPPLLTESSLRCIGFGRDAVVTLPEGLESSN